MNRDGRSVASKQKSRNAPNERAGQRTELGSQPASDTQPSTADDAAPADAKLYVASLAPIGFSPFQPSLTIDRPVLPVPVGSVAQPGKRPFRLSFPHIAFPSISFPKLSVANSSVWAGLGGSVGNEPLGGQVLGEWRVKPRWSVQTGLNPVRDVLTPEVAQAIADLRADATTQRRLDDLAERHHEDQLTPDELTEYQSLVSGINFISVLQAKARSVLTHASCRASGDSRAAERTGGGRYSR